MPRVTAQHFKTFCNACRYWAKEMGLLRYELVITHEEDLDSRATCDADPEAGIAVINLATEWTDNDPLNDEGLRKCAFHEIRELLYWEIRMLLREVYSDEVINRHLHILIRTDENILFK